MNLAFTEIVTTAMDQVLLSSLLKPVSILLSLSRLSSAIVAIAETAQKPGPAFKSA